MLLTYILDFLIPSSNILVTSFPKEDQGEDINHGAAQFTSANFYLAPIFVFVRLIEYQVCKDNQNLQKNMANNWKIRLNLMQTNSVSLEDCNSKYLQSQERFKVVSLVQSKARYRFFGLVVISRPRKYKKYRGQKLDQRIDKVQMLLVFIRGTDL